MMTINHFKKSNGKADNHVGFCAGKKVVNALI